MALLQPVLKHWAIDLFEEVSSNLDDMVRTDAQDAGIEGGVVNLAQRESIAD